MARTKPKQGSSKNLIIIGAVLLAIVAAVIAYGYSASQKNKQMAEQAAAYSAQKEAKAKFEADQAAERKRKFDSQQQAWGQTAPSEQEEVAKNTGNKTKSSWPANGAEYLERCQRMIKAQVERPSTLSFSMFSSKVYEALNGNVSVTIPFTAESAMGSNQSFGARCIFPKDGGEEINIINR